MYDMVGVLAGFHCESKIKLWEWNLSCRVGGVTQAVIDAKNVEHLPRKAAVSGVRSDTIWAAF
jgi:hypothetical protein